MWYTYITEWAGSITENVILKEINTHNFVRPRNCCTQQKPKVHSTSTTKSNAQVFKNVKKTRVEGLHVTNSEQLTPCLKRQCCHHWIAKQTTRLVGSLIFLL